jgi:flagellar motility protein MotE (MotC chaperone)
MAKLKVFITSDGLTDYVVAASSRPKALAAWGVHQDLFKIGQARETDDPALVEAASAQPGEVLRRPAGTRAELAKARPVRKAKPSGPSKAALKKVADLEQRLASLESSHDAALGKLAEERESLDRREVLARQNFEAQKSAIEKDLAKARRALKA